MISHKYKCIFIHISKCAGSSIENAFEINVQDNSEANNHNLFGWDSKNNIFLQHATPNELINYGYISENLWNSYYKFIVVRNPWSRAFSDYLWISKHSKVKDTFSNFLKKTGAYKSILKDNSHPTFRGDHLNSQKSYFFLNGQEIEYQSVIYFENLSEGLYKVSQDLNLSKNFFQKKINKGNSETVHYSSFYNFKRKKLVETLYEEDINFLNYGFEDKKNFVETIYSMVPSYYFIR